MQDEARISKMRHNIARLGKIQEDEARKCRMRQDIAR